MTLLGTFYGTATINSSLTIPGKLVITQDRIDISTNLPKLDRNWTFTDAAGHFHAVSDSKLPTLRAKSLHRECDGSCGGVCNGEGYDVTQCFCRLCDELIAPSMVPGPHYDTMPGLTDWQVNLEGFAPGAGMPGFGGSGLTDVSLRFDALDPTPRTFFGTAVWGDVELSSGLGGPPMVKAWLYGNGELGDRPLVKETVVPIT